MSAFLVISAELTDPVAFGAYTAVVPAIVQAYGGRYLVLGSAPQGLEGEVILKKTVISEWPDRAAALRFWDSPEYLAAKPLRAGCGRFDVMLVDGLPGARP